MTDAPENPFATADAWDTSTGFYLGAGDYVVKITVADDASSKNLNPQVALTFENDLGTIRDWCPYNSTFLAKVVALFDACGESRPQDGEFDPADNMRLTPQCLDRLVGKRLGIVVRDEPDFQDSTKTRARVQGYVTADRIRSDIPADTNGLSQGPAVAAAAAADDIPF